MPSLVKLQFLLSALAASVSAHTAAFTNGMYCKGGNVIGVDDANTNTVVGPLYQLSKQDWWMQHDRGCDAVPPTDGGSLEIPAGGSFTVELAHNRAFTTYSYDGAQTSDWPDGQDHPEDWHGTNENWSGPGDTGCLDSNPDGEGGALHTYNETTAAGTAFAISYNSDISQVTMENLVVFSVLEQYVASLVTPELISSNMTHSTPWNRLATYEAPADLPACPDGGCYCAWLWSPNGCGEPNMYMQNHKCHVTGTSSTRTLATAQPPVYCGDGSTACVSGAKQMIAWEQAEGNNVSPPDGISPGYNALMGFQAGAQNDIFA